MYGLLCLTLLSVISRKQLIHAHKLLYRNNTFFNTFINQYKPFNPTSAVANSPSLTCNESPKAEFNGRLIYVNGTNKHLYNASLESFLGSDLIGLDTESPVYDRHSKGNLASLIDHQKQLANHGSLPCPTVIQISGPDVCLVYNLKSMGTSAENNKLPESLVDILTNPSITKVCHGNSDFYLLKRYFNVECQNIVDLYNVCVSINSKSRSLQGAVGIYMGLYLDKSLQKSNWDSEQLTQEQIKYAATDAWVSRELLVSLRARYGLSRLPCESNHLHTSPAKYSNQIRDTCDDAVQNKVSDATGIGEYKAFNNEFNDCPFASLLNICLSRGYEFEFNNLDKGEFGIKSTLSVTIFGERLVSKSKNWHNDLLSARKDAARQLLDLINARKSN